MNMEKIHNATKDVAAVLETHSLYELEALTVLDAVRISIEANIIKKELLKK